MKKSHRFIIASSVIFAVLIISGALVVAHSRQANFSAPKQHPVSQAELKAADGKNGHNCYVAIDGTVYQIPDSAFWQNGKHTPSNGLAYCGADLSKVIDKAPHGRSILKTLTIVGSLQKS